MFYRENKLFIFILTVFNIISVKPNKNSIIYNIQLIIKINDCNIIVLRIISYLCRSN
nr:MAG TPA: hypothetical protein [Caudoviricetes sp.]